MIARLMDNIARARDTDAGDSPLATRTVQYRDSSGNLTGKMSKEVRLYNPNVAAAVKNAVYQVTYTGVPSTSPQALTCATATPTKRLVVAKEAVPIAGWGWYCYAGWTDALVEGTTDVAVGDFLKLTSGTTATAFIKDGTAETTSSHAVAGAAQTANSEVAVLVELLGESRLVA